MNPILIATIAAVAVLLIWLSIATDPYFVDRLRAWHARRTARPLNASAAEAMLAGKILHDAAMPINPISHSTPFPPSPGKGRIGVVKSVPGDPKTILYEDEVPTGTLE